MKNEVIIRQNGLSKQAVLAELEACNNKTSKFGLSLSYSQMLRINEARINALHDMDRIEFGEGVIRKIIIAFCDSPYITQDNYEETVSELQEIFYYFKNEAMERLSDDRLISYMKEKFHNPCQGSLEYLSSTILETFCRELRENE